MKSLKSFLNEKSYGPQDTGLNRDEWKSKLKQRHPDVKFTNVSGKGHESHEAHIPWDNNKRRVGVWTNREKGGPHHSMDFARLATKEETQIDEISKGTLQSYTLKALDQSHAAQRKYIATPGKEGEEALKKSKKREAGIEKAEKKIDKMSEEALEELSTRTLKSYLKSNLRKTVDKDGQPNPPLFKLKARAKGMETAISKLMKKEEALDEAKNAHFVHVHDSEDVLSSHNMIHSKAEDIAKKNNGKVTRVSNVKSNIEYPGGHSTTITTKKEGNKVKSDIKHIYEEAMVHSIGDQVICNKTKRLATVTGVENDQYTVAYGDGSTQTADASYWAPIRKANESRTFKGIREAACRTPVYTQYYKGRKLHFCGSKGKSASSRSGGSFSSGNISGEGGAGNGNGNGGGDGGGGNGGGGE